MDPQAIGRDRQIEVQVERLIDEDGNQHDRRDIERMVNESAAEFQDAPVQQFVPNLVYNQVKAQLVKDASTQGDGTGASPAH
jgi:hypothetical protein